MGSMQEDLRTLTGILRHPRQFYREEDYEQTSVTLLGTSTLLFLLMFSVATVTVYGTGKEGLVLMDGIGTLMLFVPLAAIGVVFLALVKFCIMYISTRILGDTSNTHSITVLTISAVLPLSGILLMVFAAVSAIIYHAYIIPSLPESTVLLAPHWLFRILLYAVLLLTAAYLAILDYFAFREAYSFSRYQSLLAVLVSTSVLIVAGIFYIAIGAILLLVMLIGLGGGIADQP